jgi:hypothetical protein
MSGRDSIEARCKSEARVTLVKVDRLKPARPRAPQPAGEIVADAMR